MDTDSPDNLNPYRPPEHAPDIPSRFVCDEYEIIGEILICEKRADFSKFCWLTGSTDIVQTRTVKKFVEPQWVLFIHLALLAICLFRGQISFGWTFPTLIIPGCLLGIFLGPRLWGEKVEITFGSSSLARQKQKHSNVYNWAQILYAIVGFTLIVLAVFVKPSVLGWLMPVIFAGWAVGVVVVLLFWRPTALSPRIDRHDDSRVKVERLEQPFLKALASQDVAQIEPANP